MKKVINITIGKVVFSIEDDAYEKLSQYLAEISRYFAKDTDKDEIVEDIEISMAEKFLSGRKRKDAALSLEEVEEVIKQMGTLKDFEEVEEDLAAEDDEEVQFKKKLYRDPDDVMIAGVASGLASYLGVDTVITRLAFFVTIFFGGFGVIVYVLMWILVPEAKTTAQKLEMRGEKITLKEIEKSVKSGVENLKKKDFLAVRRGSAKIRNFFIMIVRLLFSFVRIVLGSALLLAGVSGVLVLSFALAWMISGGDIPYTEVVLSDFVNLVPAMESAFLVALYCVILVPLLILVFAGGSLFKRKMLVRPMYLLVLMALWFAALGLVGSVAFQNIPLIEEKVRQMNTDFSNVDRAY